MATAIILAGASCQRHRRSLTRRRHHRGRRSQLACRPTVPIHAVARGRAAHGGGSGVRRVVRRTTVGSTWAAGDGWRVRQAQARARAVVVARKSGHTAIRAGEAVVANARDAVSVRTRALDQLQVTQHTLRRRGEGGVRIAQHRRSVTVALHRRRLRLTAEEPRAAPLKQTVEQRRRRGRRR